MISLAGRDILHSWGKFVLTGIGLGLLIGVTLTMAGVYRGMVDDARACSTTAAPISGWCSRTRRGPTPNRPACATTWCAACAACRRGACGQCHLPDDAGARQRRARGPRCAPWSSASSPASRANPAIWWPAGRSRAATTKRWPTCAPGFTLGERIRIRRHDYTVVGLTRRMVSSGGDPMVFIPLKDAQEAQFLKDNDAILNERARTAANPALNRPGVPGLLEAMQASQAANHNVNTGAGAGAARGPAPAWRADPALEAPAGLHPPQMEEILVAKLIATSAGRSACSWSSWPSSAPPSWPSSSTR
jgi:putative ABC transport system permease protein